jgi:hypothetical protein
VKTSTVIPTGLVCALLVLLSVLSVVIPTRVSAQASAPLLTDLRLVSAKPVDPNADGLYANLLITVNLTGIGSGFVVVTATLQSPNGLFAITSNDTWAAFNGSAGTHTQTCFVTLAGPLIRSVGMDGPYGLYLIAQSLTVDGVFSDHYVANTTTTPAFKAASFTPPWVEFAGPITESAVDTNGDRLYDELVLHVPLRVVTAGPVLVTGYTPYLGPYRVHMDILTPIPIGSEDFRVRFLAPGPYTWDLVFDGMAIRASRRSGPYAVVITLQVPLFDARYPYLLATQNYTTQPYDYYKFETPSATIRSPITSSLGSFPFGGASGLDIVHVPIHVRASGNYSVTATQYIPAFGGPFARWFDPTTEAMRNVYLRTGDQVVDLDFSTIYLGRLAPGQGLSLAVTVYRIGGGYRDADGTFWTETNLTAALGAVRPHAYLNISAYVAGTPCTSLRAYAVAPGTRFFLMNASSFYPPKPVRLDLYPGTFELALAGCGIDSVQNLTVRGDMTLNLAWPAVPAPVPDRYTFTFPSWNRSVVDLEGQGMYRPDNVRFFADFAGNLDGTADASELSLYLASCCLYPWLPVQASLDGSEDGPVASTVVSVQGAGPVGSSAPVSMHARYDAPVAVPPRPGSTHRVALGFLYPNGGFPPYSVEVRLPNGATGNVTMASVAWQETNVTAPANISARTLGPGSWLLTPGWAPSGYPYSSPTVTIDVHSGPSTPPVVGGRLETFSLPLFILAIVLVTALPIVFVAVVYLRRPPRPRT